ncbi:serine protease [Cohnella sp. CBP 2801]|uniref:Serine protease n=2 Tax=Cohnella zeiphila TaxID=2761120 RepID=A0A7X0VU97_9BACL|nr:serine protease [Cohnella zeiphila]
MASAQTTSAPQNSQSAGSQLSYNDLSQLAGQYGIDLQSVLKQVQGQAGTGTGSNAGSGFDLGSILGSGNGSGLDLGSLLGSGSGKNLDLGSLLGGSGGKGLDLGSILGSGSGYGYGSGYGSGSHAGSGSNTGSGSNAGTGSDQSGSGNSGSYDNGSGSGSSSSGGSSSDSGKTSSGSGSTSGNTSGSASGSNSGVTQSDYASQVVTLVNQERAKQGLSALKTDSKLTSVALAKAKDMYNNNYFDHNSPTYGSPFDMMKQFGVSYSYAGENIAKGQRDPQEVMTAWMNSAGHKANILNVNYKSIGVAYYNGEWVQEFTG